MLRKSIRNYVIWFSGVVLLLIILCYSLFALWFLSKGMDLAEYWQLEQYAISFADQYRKNPQAPLPKNEHLSSSLDFDQLPPSIKLKKKNWMKK